MSTCHSLSLAVPLVITRCTTRCITRLSFYKQSDFFKKLLVENELIFNL